MRASETVEALAKDIRSSGSPDRAAGQRAYLKSDLTHWGAETASVRTAAEKLYEANPGLAHRSVIAVIKNLWKEPVYELRSAAVELLWLYRKSLLSSDIEMIESMLRQAKTWALVDPLATSVVGYLVDSDPTLNAVLDRWATDEDFWIRRSAMLALLKPLRRGAGDFERFGRYADAMLEEKEFFIRKAIGWILRDMGRKRPELVARWLEPRAHRASGVTMREAIKPLAAEDAGRIMEIYRSRNSRNKAATSAG